MSTPPAPPAPPATEHDFPFGTLADAVERVLRDPSVTVLERSVHPLAGAHQVLALMPAHDRQLAIVKVITYTPDAARYQRPLIQGEVLVFDVASGSPVARLDGAQVTAQRTAAVSLLAARQLAPAREGPLLIVGAGVQGRSHLLALAQEFDLREVYIHSRSVASAQKLATLAQSIGLRAVCVDAPDAVQALCPLVVTATPAQAVVLRGPVHPQAFVMAVGAFTPAMREIDPALCRWFETHGRIVLDSAAARAEAGDLLQAGVDLQRCSTLQDVLLRPTRAQQGPVLFKSCGWAGWDLACAHHVIDAQSRSGTTPPPA